MLPGARAVTQMAIDRAKALKDLVESAEAGDVQAQFALGRRHFRGEAAPLDPMEAERWLKRAADQGHPVARIYLAELRGRHAQPGGQDQGFERWLNGALEQIRVGEQRRKPLAAMRKALGAEGRGRDPGRPAATPLSKLVPAVLLAAMLGYILLRIVQNGGL